MKKAISSFLVLCMLFSFVNIVNAEEQKTIKLGDYIEMGEYNGKSILWRCVSFEKISGYDSNGNPIIDSTDTVTEYKDGYLPLMFCDSVICNKIYDAKGDNESGSHTRGFNTELPSNGYTFPDGYLGGLCRKNYGSNYWGDSNIRDWLNSTESSENIVWSCGNPPSVENVPRVEYAYDNEAGFLSNFSKTENEVIMTVTQKSLLDGFEHTDSNNTANPNSFSGYSDISNIGENYAKAYSEYVSDRMFLLDIKQISTVYNNGDILGDNYYSYVNQGCNYEVCWLRTPLSSKYGINNLIFYNGMGYPYEYYFGSCFVLCINKYLGWFDAISVSGNSAIGGFSGTEVGVRPAFFINPTGVKLNGSGTYSSPYHALPIDGVKSIIWGESNNGTITSDICYAFQGDEVCVTATPNEGYVLKSIKCNGNEIKPVEGKYKFIMPNQDAVLTAEFEKLYTINISKYIDNVLTKQTYNLISGEELIFLENDEIGDKYVTVYIDGKRYYSTNNTYNITVNEKDLDIFITITSEEEEPKEKQSISISDTDAYKSGAFGGLRFITDITNTDDLEIEYYGTWMIPQALFASHLTDLQAEVKTDGDIKDGQYTADLLNISSDYFDTLFVGISFVKFRGIDNLVLGTKVTSVNGSYKEVPEDKHPFADGDKTYIKSINYVDLFSN